MDPIPHGVPQKYLTTQERASVARFLVYRLSGIKKAIATLREAQKIDTAGWAGGDLDYYLHIRGWIVQCVKQLGYDPATLEGENDA